MIKITCGACEKLLSIDENKLPMKEVAFPCPLCKRKVEIDRRKVDSSRPETLIARPAKAEPPVQAPSGGDGSADSGASAGAAAEFSSVESGGGTGRKALVVGTAPEAVVNAARGAGYNPVHIEDLQQAKEWYLQEFPELVFICPAELGSPPDENVSKFAGIGGSERRRGFFVLCGDNVRTLDGNGAFLYQVNLVIATKDLPQFGRIYTEARRDHDRLAAGFPGAEALATL